MSIKKIAERAGVSASTVSRVLNNPNYKCSSPKLRDKIWKIAIELNYTPNTAARNLKMGKFAITPDYCEALSLATVAHIILKEVDEG